MSNLPVDDPARQIEEPADQSMTSPAAEHSLAEEYPQWRFWRSRGRNGEPGELMATRRSLPLTDDEMYGGLAATLPMGFGGDLREQLAEQARRESALAIRGA